MSRNEYNQSKIKHAAHMTDAKYISPTDLDELSLIWHVCDSYMQYVRNFCINVGQEIHNYQHAQHGITINIIGHYTGAFSVIIQIRWKFHFIVFPSILSFYVAMTFFHAMTDELSLQRQNFGNNQFIGTGIRIKLSFHQIWIVMEKLYWNRPHYMKEE